jgi:hypothetical protein
MIFHVASMVAPSVNTVSQAPVVVQCSPNPAQDPVSVRLLLASIPSAFALGIAWMAFQWNRRNESDRWVRDQRKLEWRNLLDSLTSIEEAIPSAFCEQLLKLLGKDSSAPDKYLLSVAAFERQVKTILFAADSIRLIGLRSKFEDLVTFAKSMRILKDSEGRFEAFEKVDIDSYHDQFNELVSLIHRKAIEDLNA